VIAVCLAASCAEASACPPDTHDAQALPRFARPVPGEIVATFGTRYHPLLNVQRHHNGVDFSSEVGQPLVAAASGQITRAGYEGESGIAILITHQNGWQTYYAHLRMVAVRVGSCVKRGDLIGYTGNTGFTVGQIVHFEVRRDAVSIDPESLLVPAVPQ
jgi:murein DD-endopeptidase MepM/ murein hydrolase activator NlpD